MDKFEQFADDKIKPEYRSIFSQFRILVREQFPDLKEEMRGGTEKYYGVPVYRFKRIVITVSPTQQGITFSFTNGKQFEDKHKLLEGVGNKSLNLRIPQAVDYDECIMAYYIAQAIELDRT
jgi:hypothetical protein